MRADAVVLLRHGIDAEPGGGAGAVEPGAEVEVRGGGGGARTAELGEGSAGDLLAAEAVALQGVVGRRTGCIDARDRAEGIVVEALADGAGAVLDRPYASEVVGDIVEDLVRARAGEKSPALPGGALQGRCPGGGSVCGRNIERNLFPGGVEYYHNEKIIPKSQKPQTNYFSYLPLWRSTSIRAPFFIIYPLRLKGGILMSNLSPL